jgi:hypothetical protein
VLAGAAGATIIGAAINAPTAQAADGDPLHVGQNNQGASSTVLAISPASASAPLQLVNEAGPALRLLPVGNDYAGDLQPGDIVSTNFGPLVGVNYGNGREVDYLATGTDLANLPTPIAIPPQRLLDTRTAKGRSNIVRKSSSSALTSAGKLKARQWVDVAVDAATGPFVLSAIFANAAVVAPEKNGYLTVYPPSSTIPATSNIHYRTGETLANAAFVALGTYAGDYVVRLRTSQTSHLLLDLSGAVAGAGAATQPAATFDRTASSSTPSRRAQRQAKQLARIQESLQQNAR